MVKEGPCLGPSGVSLSLELLLSHFELRLPPVSAAMAAETFQKIMSAALDMKGMLISMGVPEPKVQLETPPPILFDLPRPKPLREALLKLKLRKETVSKLNEAYVSRTEEFLSKTTRELQSLWSGLHVEGSHIPLLAWENALLLTRKKTQETLDTSFDMVVDRARNLVANLSAEKRKNQPMFDQVSIRMCLSSVANWSCSALLIFFSGISPIRMAVRTPVRTKRRNSLLALV